jgi:hypothetical protein
MHDPNGFEARLAEALDRYTLRAPLALDVSDVANAAMGPEGAPARRAWVPSFRSGSLVLLLGLLILTLLLVVVGAGGRLFPRDLLAAIVPTASPVTPTPSGDLIGDGEVWIAYMPAVGLDAIEAVRPDGTGRHRLFPLVPGGEQQHPDWSPDGMRLVFSVIGTDTQVIWVGDADGTNTSLLVDCQAPCVWVGEPAWAPDGGSIAYYRMMDREGSGVSTLEILDLASMTTRIAFTAPMGRAMFAPRWSGDGTRLVFEFVTLTSPAFDSEVTAAALAILDLTSAAPVPREITDPSGRCSNPDWSWVNDLIVCSKPLSTTSFAGPSDLYTVRPDGTGLTVLTAIAVSGGEAIKPTWFPDWSRVIFGDSSGAMSTILADGTRSSSAFSGDPVRGLHPRLRPTP